MLRKNFGEGKGMPKKSEANPKKSAEKPVKNQIQAKNYDEIHSKNVYEESQKATQKTQAYLKAEEKLRHKTYAEKNYQPKEWTVKIRNCYPFASVILGGFVAFLAGDLFAQGLETVMYGVTILTIGILSLAIISLFEVFKYKSAIGVFGHGNYNLVPILVLFFGISVGISAGGGYLMSLRLNDKTADIQADFSQQTDSIKTQYGELISGYDSQIASAKETLSNHKNKWLVHSARKDLKEAQEAKAELLQKIKTESSELQTLEKTEITLSDQLNQNKAYLVVLFVMLFEILYLVSFGYEFQIERAIKTENQNHNLVEPKNSPVINLPSNSSPNPIVSNLSFEQQLILNLLSGQKAQHSTPNFFQDFTPNSNQTIGFNFSKNSPKTKINPKNSNHNEARNESRNEARTLGNGNRVCKNCGEIFVYNSPNHQYCSDDCRIEAWEKRNGKKWFKVKK